MWTFIEDPDGSTWGEHPRQLAGLPGPYNYWINPSHQRSVDGPPVFQALFSAARELAQETGQIDERVANYTGLYVVSSRPLRALLESLRQIDG